MMLQQQQVREDRERKRCQLDERHDYILTIVADHIGLELSHVQDAILEDSQQV